jgi:hypothetical protein
MDWSVFVTFRIRLITIYYFFNPTLLGYFTSIGPKKKRYLQSGGGK